MFCQSQTLELIGPIWKLEKNELAQYTRVLHFTKLERFASEKHSSLLQKFVNYGLASFIALVQLPQLPQACKWKTLAYYKRS